MTQHSNNYLRNEREKASSCTECNTLVKETLRGMEVGMSNTEKDRAHPRKYSGWYRAKTGEVSGPSKL